MGARPDGPDPLRAEFEAAVKKCNTELLSNPQDAGALRRRAEARRKLGHYKEAVADFNAALHFQPGFALALAGRGAAYRGLGNMEKAHEDLSAAVKLDPSNPLMLIDRANVRLSLGLTDAALQDLDKAVKLKPDFAMALQLRGEVHRKQRKYNAAIADFDAALRAEPRSVAALAGRGGARRALGLRQEAILDYDAALRLAPGRPSFLAGRGAVKLELRMAESARADFESALERDPSNEFARWGLQAAAQQLETAGLQITLAHFLSTDLNTVFVERRRAGFAVNGMATYWTVDGRYFLYWNEKDTRWKGSRWTDLEKVQDGSSSGFIAAPIGDDIRRPDLLPKGWFEWDGQAWAFQKRAGVAAIVALEVNVQTLTLAGFSRPELNVQYAERFRPRFIVNGHETYWSGDSEFFLYWSQQETRWKATLAADLDRVRGGRNSGFLGAPAGADILSPLLQKGWHEWDGSGWVYREDGGVAEVGVVSVPRKVRAAPQAADGHPAKVPRLATPAAAAANGRSAPLPAADAKLVPKVPVFTDARGAAAEEWT